MAMSNEELIAERKRAEKLADLCGVHGRPAAQAIFRDVAAAIGDEQGHRQRGGAPQ